MSFPKSSEKFRLFYASNPSAALCAALCAAIKPEEETIDILLLQSDFYTGDSLREYETVMLALASGYSWNKISFCNGVSRALEYAGRIAPFNSKWARLFAEIKDARRVNRRIRELVVSVTPEQGRGARLWPEEIWVDAPTILAFYVFAQHRRAKKILFPHAPAVFWGKDAYFFAFPDPSAGPAARLKRKIQEVIAGLLPAGLAPRLSLKKIAFDQAFTFTSERYLAPEVTELSPKMIQSVSQNAFRHLPKEAQSYYAEMGRPDQHGRCPSILFLPTGSERSGCFNDEMAALTHLLNATVGVRGGGPIIIKPHPRASEERINRYSKKLEEQFPRSDFRLIRKWTSVPIEVGVGEWKTTCCLGLVTGAIVTMNWFFSIPAYCPVKSLQKMYSGDPAWTRAFDNFLKFAGRFILPV